MGETDAGERLAALLSHRDLSVVRQGVELHRALRGALPEADWRRWQAQELYAWLTHHSRVPGSGRPLQLEVRAPRELHRVAIRLSRYTALYRYCCVLSIEDTPPTVAVTYGFAAAYQASRRRTVCIRAGGGALTWTFGERQS